MDENGSHLAPPEGYPSRLLFLPVFLGCLGALLCSVLFSGILPVKQYQASIGYTSIEHTIEELKADYIEAEEPFEENLPAFDSGAAGPAEVTAADKPRFFIGTDRENDDLIQELYRQPESRYRVIEFFEEICPSKEIAGAILANADLQDIPPALALALAWEESQLNHLAVNTKNKNGSTDRGLFQLNNQTFPGLELQAFFDPELNAKYGMSHLRFCLDTGGTEIAALAMYNAGTGRVQDTGTPKATLDYVSRILENRQEIERSFHKREAVFQRQFASVAEIAEAKPELEPEPEPEPERQRLVTLTPLSSMRP